MPPPPVSGSLLVASPRLNRTNFESALLLVSEHSAQGASGVISGLNLQYQNDTSVVERDGAEQTFKLWRPPFSSEYQDGLTPGEYRV